MTVHPPLLWPAYKSTVLRAPSKPPVPLQLSVCELTGPTFSDRPVADHESDLTRAGAIGERLIVHGVLRDDTGHPIPHSVIEVWQTNAAGRYAHRADQHPAPLDPNFTGVGRCVTDAQGRYRFQTIRPGAYPWRNHDNAWRPAHIHFSLFGRAFTQRLITQMYFPGDPLFDHDPVLNSVRDPAARQRLICAFDLTATEPEWALAYRFDIVLGGQSATPMEP
jgi:protocatechuate 3,4-dioxygenase beta subunit